FADPLATAAFTDTFGVFYGRHWYRSPDFFAAGIPGTGTAVGTAGHRYGGRLIGYCRGCPGFGATGVEAVPRAFRDSPCRVFRAGIPGQYCAIHQPDIEVTFTILTMLLLPVI